MSLIYSYNNDLVSNKGCLVNLMGIFKYIISLLIDYPHLSLQGTTGMLTWENTTGLEFIESTLALVMQNTVFNSAFSNNNPAADLFLDRIYAESNRQGNSPSIDAVQTP